MEELPTIQIVTPEYLQQFRKELIEEIKQTIKSSNKLEKEWIRIEDIKKLYNISAGTLQTLRNNGTIPYSKMGGTIFIKKNILMKF